MILQAAAAVLDKRLGRASGKRACLEERLLLLLVLVDELRDVSRLVEHGAAWRHLLHVAPIFVPPVLALEAVQDGAYLKRKIWGVSIAGRLR